MSVLGVLRKAAARWDGWANTVLGLGAGTSRRDFQFTLEARIDDITLEALYHQDGFAARIVDAIPKQALRQGLTVNMGTPAMSAAMTSRLDELNVEQKLKQTWIWARDLGGALLFVGADDGLDPKEPLNESAIKSIRFLEVIDKRDAIPEKFYDDPFAKDFGEPELYRFTRTGAGATANNSSLVHATRCIRFNGGETSARRRRENNGWHDSVLQRVYDKLQQFNGSAEALSALLGDASQGVFKLKGFLDMMAGDADDLLKRRLAIMDTSRSIAKSIMLDADGESFEKSATSSMTGVAEVMHNVMLLLAGAAEMPVTVLFGMAPAGLNATGDSDIRNWYDIVQNEQRTTLRPRVEHLLRLVMLAKDSPTRGQEPPNWSVAFPSLWQPTPKEKLERRKMVADIDSVYIDKGVITAGEVALSHFGGAEFNEELNIDTDVRTLVESTEGSTVDPSKPTPTTAPADQPVQETALTGIQITSMMTIIKEVAMRSYPREVGVAALVKSFSIPESEADALMGEVGRTFFIEGEPPEAP